MDVRCERCQTEYEVEDARVSDLGTQVQCGDCGHRFVVKRPAPVAGEPAPAAGAPSGPAEWKLVTTLGQVYPVRDLTLLQKWIVEGRVTPDDTLCRDGRTWEAAGTLAELAPFFALVDNARPLLVGPDEVPVLPLVPLQPPVLPQHNLQRVPNLAVPGLPSATPRFISAADSLGAVPQPADIGETEMIDARASGSRRLAKLALAIVVAAGTGYAGIGWQNRHLRTLVIASAGSAEAQPAGPTKIEATVLSPGVPVGNRDQASATSPGQPDGGSSLPAPAAAGPTPAAQGYAALNHGDYAQAIVLLKRALDGSPGNGTALFGLAEAYRGAGHKVQALHCYRRYLAMMPAGPDAAPARLRVHSLEAVKR